LAAKGRRMAKTLKDRIKENMGLKFAIALSGWIALVMLIATFLTGRSLMVYQERSVEIRGRDMGMVLAKAALDRVVSGDLVGLNMLVQDVIRSEDILAVVFTRADGTPMTSARASFNMAHPDVKAALEAEKSDDVVKLESALRRAVAPVEVTVGVEAQGAKIGKVSVLLSRASIRDNAAKIVLLLVGMSCVIVLSISLLIYFMVGKMIVNPTRVAESVATRVAGGDLTQSVRVNSVDEIGNLGRGLNRMIMGLKDMIVSVRDSWRKLDSISSDVSGVSSKVIAASQVQAEAVDEAASSVNEMHFSLKEIAGTVEDLDVTSEQTSSAVIETAASIDEVARLMTDLASSIEETSSAITEMSAAIGITAENVASLSQAADETATSSAEISSSVREVEGHARQSAALAEAVAVDAQNLGMRSIDKAVEGMQLIENESRRSAEVINRLGNRAESIGSILTVIEDITDQTALLALNAAILAAQAGEHGKGFSVVAAEIRELANRTASSTKEIGKLIAAVQEDSREAVNVMGRGVELSENGTQLVREAGNSLRKILERAGQALEMSRTISRAAAEQTAGMRQVNEAVDRINTMAHQIERATIEQRSGSEQITHAAERMREITRFVKSATAEQVKASRTITAAVEAMSGKVDLVNRAAGEVRAGSDLIVKAIERIKTAARENADLSTQLNSAVEVLGTQAVALKQGIERFTL
jgi:methyl-accepting chemotaxis protein